MDRTVPVPWFARAVHFNEIWCLSGMLFMLRPVAARTYPVRQRPAPSAAPDNTNEGTQ